MQRSEIWATLRGPKYNLYKLLGARCKAIQDNPAIKTILLSRRTFTSNKALVSVVSMQKVVLPVIYSFTFESFKNNNYLRFSNCIHSAAESWIKSHSATRLHGTSKTTSSNEVQKISFLFLFHRLTVREVFMTFFPTGNIFSYWMVAWMYSSITNRLPKVGFLLELLTASVF